MVPGVVGYVARCAWPYRSHQRAESGTKYYSAVGRVVDSALAVVIRSIMALPDIPEYDSWQLSELCQILNALKRPFAEDPDEVCGQPFNFTCVNSFNVPF